MISVFALSVNMIGMWASLGITQRYRALALFLMNFLFALFNLTVICLKILYLKPT